jgi:hypothetical protein
MSANDRCVEKLENRGLRKSRKFSALAISAAARLCRIDTSASDRFCGNSCGPSPRSEKDSPAVLRIFSHQRKRTFFNSIDPKRTLRNRLLDIFVYAGEGLLAVLGALRNDELRPIGAAERTHRRIPAELLVPI